jgi:hypothetical protein
MEPDEQKIFHNNVNVDDLVESMRGQSVSSELVKSIYDQLSKEDDELMKERFYYYKITRKNYLLHRNIYYWTSRYLITGYYKSPDPDFHEIKIFDAFNDKSM